MRLRVNAGGNFCGHQPDNPRIALTEPVPTGKGGLPGVITTLMERVTRYYRQPWSIPSLNLANQSKRQQRSERREACLSVLWAVLKYTDLVTMRVGVPTPDGFLSLTVRYLAKQTGLPQRRVERALADLKRAGLIGVHARCEKQPDGSYKGIAAIKTVSKLLFAMFGLKFRLAYERTRASKRLDKKQRQQRNAPPSTITATARRELTARAALDNAGSLVKGLGSKPARSKRMSDRTSDQEFEHRRRVQLMAIEYKQAHPDWNSEACREAAEKAIDALDRR